MSITEAEPTSGHRGDRKPHSKMDMPLFSDRYTRHSSRSRSRSRGRDNYHHRGGRHWNNNHHYDHRPNRGGYDDDRNRRERSRDRYHDRNMSRRDERFGNRGGHRSGNGYNNYYSRGGNHHHMPAYKIKATPADPNLQQIDDDPRGNDPTKRITETAKRNGNGRNTESFDPASTLIRPDIRVWVGSNADMKFTKPLKHDDVVIVPELFGPESNWDIYYKLVSEMRSLQSNNVKGSEWISWHEGSHLISKNPVGSPTFEQVIDKLCEYFCIRKKSVGTRFNWYRDSSDWKPFHHDSA